jgi:hypothetical protein
MRSSGACCGPVCTPTHTTLGTPTRVCGGRAGLRAWSSVHRLGLRAGFSPLAMSPARMGPKNAGHSPHPAVALDLSHRSASRALTRCPCPGPEPPPRALPSSPLVTSRRT